MVTSIVSAISQNARGTSRHSASAPLALRGAGASRPVWFSVPRALSSCLRGWSSSCANDSYSRGRRNRALAWPVFDARTRIAAFLLARGLRALHLVGLEAGRLLRQRLLPGRGGSSCSALLAFGAAHRQVERPGRGRPAALLALASGPCSRWSGRRPRRWRSATPRTTSSTWRCSARHLGRHLLGPHMRAGLARSRSPPAWSASPDVYVLATGDDFSWYLHEDATLRFPIGYRNANAAFFLICLWPLLPLAVGEWQLRAALTGVGTLLFELAFLCQSRGSLPAAAIAALVYLAVTAGSAPAAAIASRLSCSRRSRFLPTLLDVFRHGDADPAVIPLLRDSARRSSRPRSSLLVAAVAFGGVEPRHPGPRADERAIATAACRDRGRGRPGRRRGLRRPSRRAGRLRRPASRRVHQVGYPDLREQGVRYGANVGSNRHDFWRVAYREGLDDPLLGGGGGSFEAAYQEERLAARDAGGPPQRRGADVR